ncbi:MotA/TolQ/ExbB proton channel family protein [Desulfothermus okinawensis JCM 13304]
MQNNLRITLVFFIVLYSTNVFSSDVRVNMKNIDEQKRFILKKSHMELNKAKEEYVDTLNKIKNNKTKLLLLIKKLEQKKKEQEKESQNLKQDIQHLEKEHELLLSIFEKNTSDIKELVGQIRINAKDLETILKQSPYSAIKKHRERLIKPILDKSQFPGMKEIKNMAELLFDEILNSSEVSIKKGVFIDRKGNEKQGEILFIGPFTQMYKTDNDSGFLLYSDKSQRFFALSKPAPYLIKRQIRDYLHGKSELAPVDISKGGAIREFSYEVDLWEKILSGGPLVWPILFIGFASLILILERFYTLKRKYIDPNPFMEKLEDLIVKGKWDMAQDLCSNLKQKVLPNIMLKAIINRNLSREGIENILQEEILKNIPKLERFLSTLGMLAKIAPLLGLLGTVTGMINTFHVITYFGTSDPKLMSGGISEALVTTMLGLSVAIPIMFFHTILTRMVENYISSMEENAISLVNTIFSNKN